MTSLRHDWRLVWNFKNGKKIPDLDFLVSKESQTAHNIDGRVMIGVVQIFAVPDRPPLNIYQIRYSGLGLKTSIYDSPHPRMAKTSSIDTNPNQRGKTHASFPSYNSPVSLAPPKLALSPFCDFLLPKEAKKSQDCLRRIGLAATIHLICCSPYFPSNFGIWLAFLWFRCLYRSRLSKLYSISVRHVIGRNTLQL